MATKDELKEYIKGRVKTNTNKEITGNSLQTVLCRMVDELDLNDSCQVVLIRYTNGPTTFGDLKKLYDANKAVVVQFGEGYNILITQVSSTAFTGYRFNLNSGSTDEGGLGIVSMTATRYTFTEEGLTLDNFTVSSNGGSGGDQPASLTWAYSDYEGEGTPPDPDTNPSLWYAAKKDSSVWAALKEDGGAWNIWRLKPYTGKDGRGIKTTQVSYVLSDQGITPPTTGWNINMPNIEVGKYLWSRTIITYTDDTTSTIYSVTYIGKDGNDGKNGTSVTIKGTLESIDDLPTDPKPTPGDGYIVNGNLWTYTGTTLENDENHKGFTNVGPIKGDQGNSACLHIAWTNSLAPDWTNFTTQKPSGQKFKYMGTYVDYSADPSTCVDSQNPTDYHWQDVSGENGESVIVADLDNEIESIALDYEGKTTEALAFTPVVSMWYGLTKLTLDSLTAKVVGSIYYRNVTANPDVSTGTVTVGLQGGILITSFQVEITAKATVRGQSYIKQVVFSVNCVKAGAPGEDVTLYSLQPSVSAIHKDKNGNIDPVSITCKKLKTIGSTQGETQDGVLKYKIDNGSLLNYSGAIDCSLISSKIRFEYSVGGVLWDAEDVFVIRDGKDGNDGDTPYIVDSKTKTEYAITTNTEIPTSWSPTPIEGIPGQYLWIRITYTWSNDSTTVSLSYSRCGSDGSSGTSKATVVNYQGPWKADGLYTGMEDDTTIRVDVVYYQGTGESDGKYYLAIQSKQFINQTTPAPNTAGGKAYWGAFQGQFANIATGLLFTETAVIENAIVRVLQTGSEGARIETVGNELVSYDKTGVQRVILSPEENISISESDYDTSTNVELVTLAFSVNNMNTGGETYQAKIDSQAYTHELIQMQEAGEIWETKILDERVGYALLGKYTQISSTGSDIDKYQFESRPCIISGFTKEYSKYFSGIGTIPGANMLEIKVIPDYDMNSPNFTTRYELIARRCFKEGQVEKFEEYTLINKTLSTYLSYFELGGTSNIVSKLTKFETGQSDSDDLSIPELKAGVYKFYLRLWIEPKDVSLIEVDDRYGSTVKVKFVNEKNYADEEEVGSTLNAYPVLLYTSSVGKGLYLTSDTFLFMQSRKRYFQLRRYKQTISSGEKYERFSVEAMVDNNFLKLGSNEGFQIETQETFNLSEGFLRYPNVLILKSVYVRNNLAKVLKDFATIRTFPKAQYLPLFLETDGYGRVPLHLLSDSSAVAYACGYAANVNETTVVQYTINSKGLTTKTAKVQQVRTYSYNTLNAAAYTEIRDLVQNGYTVYINGYYSDSDWSGVYFSARVCCYGRMTSSGGVIPQNSYYILAQDFIGYPNASFNTKDYTIKIYLTSTGTKGMKVNSV